jgi:hypothetical protein
MSRPGPFRSKYGPATAASCTRERIVRRPALPVGRAQVSAEPAGQHVAGTAVASRAVARRIDRDNGRPEDATIVGPSPLSTEATGHRWVGRRGRRAAATRFGLHLAGARDRAGREVLERVAAVSRVGSPRLARACRRLGAASRVRRSAIGVQGASGIRGLAGQSVTDMAGGQLPAAMSATAPAASANDRWRARSLA